MCGGGGGWEGEGGENGEVLCCVCVVVVVLASGAFCLCHGNAIHAFQVDLRSFFFKHSSEKTCI